MKTTDPRDPLDQQIDSLLASRPVKPSDDFTSRILAAAEAERAPQAETADAAPEQNEPRGTLLRFALPIATLAAALAIALVILLSKEPASTTEFAHNKTPVTPTDAALSAPQPAATPMDTVLATQLPAGDAPLDTVDDDDDTPLLEEDKTAFAREFDSLPPLLLSV